MRRFYFPTSWTREFVGWRPQGAGCTLQWRSPYRADAHGSRVARRLRVPLSFAWPMAQGKTESENYVVPPPLTPVIQNRLVILLVGLGSDLHESLVPLGILVTTTSCRHARYFIDKFAIDAVVIDGALCPPDLDFLRSCAVPVLCVGVHEPPDFSAESVAWVPRDHDVPNHLMRLLGPSSGEEPSPR